MTGIATSSATMPDDVVINEEQSVRYCPRYDPGTGWKVDRKVKTRPVGIGGTCGLRDRDQYSRQPTPSRCMQEKELKRRMRRILLLMIKVV